MHLSSGAPACQSLRYGQNSGSTVSLLNINEAYGDPCERGACEANRPKLLRKRRSKAASQPARRYTAAHFCASDVSTFGRHGTLNWLSVPSSNEMGKAYNQDQRDRVKALLEAGRDEETIEKETQVSDRTIRRWKMELERTGRIGKPPESRTGRHRVLNPEVETVSERVLVSRRLLCAVD